jgi:glycosyltransferase involved in cell wall biosynthesis
MNVLVLPHQMVIGGSQINALELAATVRDRGHNVTVFAQNGVLSSMVRQLGLPFIPTEAITEYPSPHTCRQLIRLVRDLNIDVVHAYEWRPALEATFGPHLFRGIPVLITVLSMSVPKFLPTHIPLVVGTHELSLRAGAQEVYLIEPPIDTVRNCASNVSAARARWSFEDNDIVVSVVCRLTTDLEKLQGVLQAIESVGKLATQLPIKLLIAGGGDGMRLVEERAAMVNAQIGRRVVYPVGEMLDPRDAYEAADIVLGMGSSVLRGMAFSKPVIVQGTSGFWRILDESTLDLFLTQGWFGHSGRGVEDLSSTLSCLLVDPGRRAALGSFGRAVVVERFSLDRAADQLLAIYDQMKGKRTPRATWIRSMAQSAARVAKFRTVMALKARPNTSLG